MKLVGMLDSPYVRRVAVCLDALGVPFDHAPVSVFSTFERFRSINPVVKAPTLVCDDGGILMDSSLILQYIEAEHCNGRSPLWAAESGQRIRQFRTLGYALAGCEKAVQLVYETSLRPPPMQHEPWKARVRLQMRAAFDALEHLASTATSAPVEPDHAGICQAVVWQFVQSQSAARLPPESFPHLEAHSQLCEASPLFRRWPPDGPGVPGTD